ncbi:MAG: Jag N-terminal domain-containing protein [Acidobacteriota bacterium]|nr:Jag N-terminal domain-containing protein [Acidobacteriota bacterium]
MSHRFEGRSLEEALQSATETLGVERWQLTYHVLLEKRGFLGGVKRIVLEADINTSAPAPAAAPAAAGPAAPHESSPPRRAARAERSSGGGRGERGGGGGRGRDGGGGRRGGGRGRGRSESDFQTGDFETFLGDVPEQGPESDGARAVREWCATALALAKLSMVARTEENETQIVVRLYGSDAKLLIDRHGELLDAVQVLANKALVGRSIEKDIELDCEDFKARRSEDLEQRAREIADRVRRAGREELLPAMTPIERRIVHIALRDDADVTTESRGDGFYKRVAILLRSEAQVSEPAEAQPPQEP